MVLGTNDLPPEILKSRVMRLTTVGRKSGKPRSVKVWFVPVGGDEIAVQHARAPAPHWYRNIEQNPNVTLDFGSLVVRGRAIPVTDPKEVEEILRRVREKYGLLARLLQLFGTKGAVAVRIKLAGEGNR
ncbi:MAG: nitroreductase family deazaflavin-dependent oxidoreductase [Candidatus Binatia bacterium]|nr:nitroreductase family deazaflavin-dependent oxidoreductase [Candidatus Binatia bacterium]